MNRRRWKTVGMVSVLLLAVAAGWWLTGLAGRPGEGSARLAIVDARGATVIDLSQIDRYDRGTHTITLHRKAVPSLHLAEGESLARGVPFRMMVNGQECYRGTLTSSSSSKYHDGHVINLEPVLPAEGIYQIEYHPPETPNAQTDARADVRVLTLLRSLGKLDD